MATDPDDSRIGEYLSVLLAELLDPKASNAGTASVEEGHSEEGQRVGVCRVMIQQAQGEDIWNWGVEDSVCSSDGQALPETIRCLGGG